MKAKIKNKILEALMSTWVRGWYSGTRGDRTDNKKLIDAPEIMKNQLTNLPKQYNNLYEACKAQHETIDRLAAIIITKNRKFLFSKSGQPWKAFLQGNKAIEEAEKI